MDTRQERNTPHAEASPSHAQRGAARSMLGAPARPTAPAWRLLPRLTLTGLVVLLPTVVHAAACLITWQHPTPQAVAGYRLYRSDVTPPYLLADIPVASLEEPTDPAWRFACAPGERYSVTAYLPRGPRRGRQTPRAVAAPPTDVRVTRTLVPDGEGTLP